MLETIVKQRPRDPEAFGLLGRARLAAGDAFGALLALATAARLQPERGARWLYLAQAQLAQEPPQTAAARRAVQQALALDARDVNARYWLGRVEIAEGRTAEGLARWRALAAELPADDAARQALLNEIAARERGPQAADPAIVAMVEGLAERLERQPDDPEGWARLARAYAVLGRERELSTALAQARRLFADRPAALARIEAEAAAGRRVQRGP